MPVYTMAPRSPYERTFRWLAGGTTLLLVASLGFSIWTPAEVTDRTRESLGWTAVALVLFAVFAAYWLAIKQGLWKANRDYSIELVDDKLIQRRPGSPVVEVLASQIASIIQTHGWILITGGEPEKRIAVPPNVMGVEILKRELSAHLEIQTLRTPPRFYLPGLVYITVCCFVFGSQNPRVIVVAGCIGALVEAAWLYIWHVRTKHIRKSKLVTMYCAASLLLLAWIVVERAILKF